MPGTMRILTVSDKVQETLYGPYVRANAGHVDLILSAGDIPFDYLDFLMTSLQVPAYFVYGNHGDWHDDDNEFGHKGFRKCCDLDGRVVEFDGMLIAGLEGSIRYTPRAPYQYNEYEMAMKIVALVPRLLYNRVRYGRYLDVLVTHSPPKGIHDGQDRPHRGFRSFLTFMRWFRPRYLIHGHQHVYNSKMPTITTYYDTTVINTYGHKYIQMDLRR
jgi:uncharacterized protein